MTAPVAAGRARLPRAGRVWVAWRQHRATFALLLIPAAAPLTLIALTWHATWRINQFMTMTGCPARMSSDCVDWVSQLSGSGYPVWLVPGVVALLPMLFGVGIGAPLLAEEFTHRTHRFAWTQGVGVSRWIAGQTAIVAGAAAGVTGLLAVAGNWWIRPFERAGLVSPWQLTGFGLAPPAAAGWAAFAVCLGILTGAVCRRPRLAMAITLALLVGVLRMLPGLLRGLLSIAPLTVRGVPATQRVAGLLLPPDAAGGGPPSSPVLASWYTRPGGQRLSGETAARITRAIPRQLAASPGQVQHWLAQRHLTFWVAFQPDSRCWLFQGLAALCLLAAAGLLTAATIGIAHRWRS